MEKMQIFRMNQPEKDIRLQVGVILKELNVLWIISQLRPIIRLIHIL